MIGNSGPEMRKNEIRTLSPASIRFLGLERYKHTKNRGQNHWTTTDSKVALVKEKKKHDDFELDL